MNIYVGKLSRSVTEDALRELFAQFGEVTKVRIIIDRMTGQQRDFAFVEMPDEAQAQAAIAALDKKEFQGQGLRVNEARPQEARPRTGGGNGGGGSRFGGPRSGGDRFGGNRSSSGGGWGSRGA
jgi:RNA recognition motif-containing protein